MSSDPETLVQLRTLFQQHTRHWRDNVYVYPVISRRAHGLSIGINLNPDKACNFDCVYCQVDRTVPPAVRKVDMAHLRAELEQMMELVTSGRIFDDPQFAHVPEGYRRINDVAFSGDGEPTTSPHFHEAVELAAGLRRRFGDPDMKLVLITDAAYLDKPAVRETLSLLDANNGEIWAKLDAGTETYYQLINRPNVPLAKIIENITFTAKVRPVVIQSLWMNVHGQPPPAEEVLAFADRLNEITGAGGQIKLVQVYTIARTTAESWVSMIERTALEPIAAMVRERTGLRVEVYGG